jgi:hypothetical protein
MNTSFFSRVGIVGICIHCLCSITYAQYGNTTFKEVEEVKRRILIVGLEEEESYKLVELEGQKDHLSKYKATVEGKNRALRKAVEESWKYSAEVVFLPTKEARKLFKKDKDKYAYLHFGEELENGRIANGFMGRDPYLNSNSYYYQAAEVTYDYRMRKSMECYNVYTLHIDLPSSNAITVYLSKSCPTQTDVTLALLQMQYTFNYLAEDPTRSVRKLMSAQLPVNAIDLRSKTLLIDATDFMVKTTNEDIKKVYAYPFRLVNYQEIEQAVIAKDTNVVVVNFGRINDDSRLFYVLNAGTGKIYNSFTNQAYPVLKSSGGIFTIYYPGIRIEDIEEIGR